jgi:uncharacterized protein YbaA (DUF1428 family)
MPKYVDGYVVPVLKKHLKAYFAMSRKAGKVWLGHGALEYRECGGDDLDVTWGLSFPKLAKLKKGETVVFAWIVFKSRKDRDRVNAAVMKDPRLAGLMDESKKISLDSKRMTYGGFIPGVDLVA